mmetsp:Transcript_56484/g.131957  ORF Transcript_56484/g.131957 Transcript_56484/m.131957 type:complete len:241 (+) Transcript_56484:1472-2194(+)
MGTLSTACSVASAGTVDVDSTARTWPFRRQVSTPSRARGRLMFMHLSKKKCLTKASSASSLPLKRGSLAISGNTSASCARYQLCVRARSNMWVCLLFIIRQTKAYFATLIGSLYPSGSTSLRSGFWLWLLPSGTGSALTCAALIAALSCFFSSTPPERVLQGYQAVSCGNRRSKEGTRTGIRASDAFNFTTKSNCPGVSQVVMCSGAAQTTVPSFLKRMTAMFAMKDSDGGVSSSTSVSG